MSSFDIEIYGMVEITAALADYPKIAEPIMHKASDAALLGMVPTLADYPPELPSQRYMRTMTLEQGWLNAQPEFQPIPTGFEASLTNPTDYTAHVQSAFQRPAFRGRWRTDEAIVQRHVAEIEQLFSDALQEVADAIDATTHGGPP